MKSIGLLRKVRHRGLGSMSAQPAMRDTKSVRDELPTSPFLHSLLEALERIVRATSGARNLDEEDEHAHFGGLTLAF
jgi:hypothetical protein